MGQKLNNFLQAFAGGLSPQVFQANLNKEAAATADKRLQQRESRAEDRNIRQISITQGIKSLGVLATAINDTDINTQEGKKKIDGLMKNAKEITNGFKDKRIIDSMKNSFAAQLGVMKKDKSEKTGITMIDPDGNEFMAFQRGRQFKMRDKAGNLVAVPHGSIKAPTKQLTGELSKTQKGKLTLGGIEGEQNLRNNLRDIDSLMETVSSPDFLGGNLGNAVQALNSARQQVSQMFGGEDYLTEDGKVNPKAFRTNSKFRKMAITGDLAESQKMELAFILAKALNPDGKISDADVRQAGKILGESADPQVRKRLLDDVKKRIVSRYNSDQSVIAKKLKKPFTPLTMEGLGSVGLKKKTGSAASRIMQNVGFPE